MKSNNSTPTDYQRGAGHKRYDMMKPFLPNNIWYAMEHIAIAFVCRVMCDMAIIAIYGFNLEC